MGYVVDHNDDVIFTNSVLRLVYFISKVRGFRGIGTLPVSVALSPAFCFSRSFRLCYCSEVPAARCTASGAVSSADRSRVGAGFDSWQARYALLLWLSIVVLVPFGLSTIDAQTAAAADVRTSCLLCVLFSMLILLPC